jgi:CheY-like chemotaxis protein
MIDSAAELGHSVRVLLVEDEALVAMFAEEVLSSLGFEPTIARTGAEARNHWAQFTPDLAVIDVGLPDMRGDALARELRARMPNLPILMASGYDVVELREAFEGDEHTAFLPKPYTEEDLVRAARGLGFDLKDQ